MFKIAFLILTATLLVNCKTTQDYVTPYEHKGPQISFGSGGGFSGRVNQFTLLSNGQLFKGTNYEGNVTVMDKVDSDRCAQIFSLYNTLGFADLAINDPGNMYYFIKMKEEGTDEHNIKWGGTDVEAPETLKLFYKNLMNLTVTNTVSNSVREPASTK